MLYIHNKGNQFQVERDFFEYIDGNSIPYVILCKDVIYLGKQVLNSKVTETDLIKELKKY